MNYVLFVVAIAIVVVIELIHFPITIAITIAVSLITTHTLLNTYYRWVLIKECGSALLACRAEIYGGGIAVIHHRFGFITNLKAQLKLRSPKANL